MKKFYITTPIYYVNAAPHIGHSYTCVAADALARYARGIRGMDKVWFLTGTDEHGQKIQKAADEAGKSPQQFVDEVVVQFKGLWESLDISNNDFIRTTEVRHVKTVRRVLEILHEKGDIYQDKYEGWYCTPCETFWPPSQVEGRVCPDCKRPLENISESNYFFKLSAYQPWLVDYIEAHPDFIRPQIRRNEVLSFLRSNKLNNLCISRPKERLGWGIPLPFSPDHVTYVWFDALINYISGVGSFDDAGNYSSSWWSDDTEIVHLIGKDILRQHAVYWPIMLKALGLRIPDTVFAHGWWMIDQDKMSKSRGNVVDPREMVERFGIDAYRYFLLRDVPFGMDGNFSIEAITKRYNSDLANDLGNLVYRTLTMIEKYYHGKVPGPQDAFDDTGKAIYAGIRRMPEQVMPLLSAGGDFNFSSALDVIWSNIAAANKYVEQTKPWNLAKEKKSAELSSFIRLLAEAIRSVAVSAAPVMPGAARSIEEQLGQETIAKQDPLFPRIE